MHRVAERLYERLRDGRTVLAHVPGDEISDEHAKALGIVGKGERIEMPPVDDPRLLEGIVPLDGSEADARATGETAERAARERARSKKKRSGVCL